MKPSNVLITKDAVVKLADFGIAENREKADRYTPNGFSFAYIAPEIAQNVYETGKLLPFDNKVDIWGIGCIAYEMIIGKMRNFEYNT